jgi:hypothetical protein
MIEEEKNKIRDRLIFLQNKKINNLNKYINYLENNYIKFLENSLELLLKIEEKK